MKKTKKQKQSKQQPPTTGVPQSPKVVIVAVDIAQLNQRESTIQSELGTLNAKTSKLYAEMNGIQRRRLELMREFDSSAKL